MKKLRFAALMMGAVLMSAGFTACSEDDNVLDVDDKDQSAPEITIVEGDNTAAITVFANDYKDTTNTINVNVKFTSSKSMKRIYMTENIAGAGAVKYELDIKDLKTKADGSIDLSSAYANELTFSIPFPILSDMTAGTVEYQIWATSGRGDYRDITKRNLAGQGTITINYGGDNPAAEVKEYTATILAAPTDDGKSETFISLIDGELYKINEGEEMVAYWDFGYFYGLTNNASLASTYDYPSNVIDIVSIAKITDKEDLNKTYFAISTMNFDNVVYASDLNGIVKSDKQTITKLKVGDVVEFVDNYDNKGLIKVTEIKGTYNAGDYIKLNIKVQN